MDETILQYLNQQRFETKKFCEVKGHQLEFLNKIITFIEKEWYLHILDLLKNEGVTITVMVEQSQEYKIYFEEIRKEATEKSEEIYKQFPRLIQD